MAKKLSGSTIIMLILAFFLGVIAAFSYQQSLTDNPLLASGRFDGKAGHAATGGVSLLKTSNGVIAILEPDFSIDSSPDPRVGFGKDGHYEKETEFSVLYSSTGAQIYHIPEDIQLTDFNEFWVWCRKVNVPIGAAKLD